DVATWRLVFFINVPLGLGVLWMLARYVPESRGSAAAGGIDWLGSALAVFGLGALVFGLIDGGKFGFDRPLASGAIVLGIVLLVAFVAAEARSANPMMPLSLFRSRNFSGANLLTVLLYAPLGGGTLFLPILMIEVYDYSAMLAGAAMLPVVVLLVTLSRFFGGLLPRTGATALLITGPLIAGAGWAYFSLPWFSGGYWTTFFPGFVLLGLGMAIVVAPLTTVVMTSFDDSKAGVASGINNAASRTAGLVAVALFGALVTVVFNLGLDARIAELMLPAGVSAALAAQENLMTAARIPAGLGDEMSLALENAIDQSLLAGVRAAMVLSAALAFASAAFAALMIRYKPAAGK
ncbi:MAG: MFS transporter, partial [Proteobacteria bacterium]|nr:MFS transporter [Pseudomonadota bacterium]